MHPEIVRIDLLQLRIHDLDEEVAREVALGVAGQVAEGVSSSKGLKDFSDVQLKIEISPDSSARELVEQIGNRIRGALQ